MSQFALRWILMFDAVTCAIPGGKRAEQVADNCQTSDLPPLTGEVVTGVRRIYNEKIRAWCTIAGSNCSEPGLAAAALPIGGVIAVTSHR